MQRLLVGGPSSTLPGAHGLGTCATSDRQLVLQNSRDAVDASLRPERGVGVSLKLASEVVAFGSPAITWRPLEGIELDVIVSAAWRTDATLIRKLGESWFRAEAGQVPAGYEEQVHHAFHLGVDRPNSSATWEWDECDGGEEVKWRYTSRCIAVDAAGALLHASQAMWLPVLRCSLSQAWSPEG